MHARLDAGRCASDPPGKDWTDKYPAIARPSLAPGASRVPRRRLCGVRPDGRTAFNLIQNAGDGDAALVFFLFDLLFLDGEDLRGLPLVRAQGAGGERCSPTRPTYAPLQRSPDRQGPAFYRVACEHGLEGIVSKRDDGRMSRDGETG